MEYTVECKNCKYDCGCNFNETDCLDYGKCRYTNTKYNNVYNYSLFEPLDNIRQHYKLKEETTKMKDYKTINKIGTESKNINIEDVNNNNPIFALKNGKLYGMIVKQNNSQKWILRIGGDLGAYGLIDTLEDCIAKGQKRGFTFITP